MSLQKTQNLTHCFVSHLFFLHSMRLSRSNNDMMFQKMLQQHLFVSIFWMFNGKAKQQYFKQWSLEKIFEGTQFKELTDINFYWNSGHGKFWLPEVRTSILVYIKMSKMRIISYTTNYRTYKSFHLLHWLLHCLIPAYETPN